MTGIILVGYGKMGRIMEELIDSSKDMECMGIIGSEKSGLNKSMEAIVEGLVENHQKANVVIDFSHPDNLDMILEGMKKYPLPLVMATTGFSDLQIRKIEELSQGIPIVLASNFSLGITLMKRVVRDMQSALGVDFDIEIIEKHHNRKLDSPSGTAITLLNAIDPNKKYLRKYGREGMGKRSKEIGVHSIRGGSIAGEHTVIFAGENEVIELTHKADSKNVFAKGAIKAADFILGKPPGIYDMDHVLGFDGKTGNESES